MREASKKSSQLTLWDTDSVTGLLESEDGHLPSGLQVSNPSSDSGRPVCHANPYRLPAESEVRRINGTSGRNSTVSSQSVALQSLLASSLRARMDVNGSMEFHSIWKSLVSPSQRQICQLQALGHRTKDSDFTGELFGWPTPNTMPDAPNMSENRGDGKRRRLTPQSVAGLVPWPTPLAARADRSQRRENRNSVASDREERPPSDGTTRRLGDSESDDKRRSEQSGTGFPAGVAAGGSGPGLGDTMCSGLEGLGRAGEVWDESGWQSAEPIRSVGKAGVWDDYWLAQCVDGKQRRVGTGIHVLASGIPFRTNDPELVQLLAGLRGVGVSPEDSAAVLRAARRNRIGRLKGYGNAIVPQLAALFLRSLFDSIAAYAACSGDLNQLSGGQ